MALIKHRPKISLMVPRILLPGQEFCATIVVEARRPVPVEWLDVTLEGTENSRVGSGQYQSRQSYHIVKLYARVTGEGELPEGRTEYRCRFTIPPGAPPSYKGLGVTVAYKMCVRASIPWWPDAKPEFWINVSTPPRAMAKTCPMLYSTEPAGPRGRDPHMEVSLSDSTFMPGDALRGAVALHNVAYNRYNGLRAVLLARESVTAGSRSAENKPQRYKFDIPLSDPLEGQSIPFSLRVPAGVPASYDSKLWRLDWGLQFRAMMRWSRDMVVEVPLTMAPRPYSDSAINRQFHAPPSVGEERLLMVWRKVAKASDLVFDGQVIRAERGGVEVSVGREHRGSDGIFVVASLTCPPLNLDLGVERAGALRLLSGGLSMDRADWDRKYLVKGRDREQVRAVLCGQKEKETSLVQWLMQASGVEMDDEELKVLWRDAGQSEAALQRIVDHALVVARQLDHVRRRIPAPAAMEEATDAWTALADRLQGPLETARMAIAGNFQGIPCEVITVWDPGGDPLHTSLALRPPLGISTSCRLDLEADGDDLTEHEGAVAELPGEARELLPAVVAGAHSLNLTDEALTVFLDAPLMDPGPVYERLALMARLVAAVQPNAGPYR